MLYIKTMVFYGKLEESAVFCWMIRTGRNIEKPQGELAPRGFCFIMIFCDYLWITTMLH